MKRTWTCRGCGTAWPRTKRKCACGRSRPAPRRPKHQLALETPYEWWAAAYGETCGICKRPPGPARRLDRDHDHKTGRPRGLLCPICNKTLGGRTAQWLRDAWRYLVRAELMGDGRLQWVEEDRGHLTPCWIWQRALHSSGYAVIRYSQELLYVHRIMCPGPLPADGQVDHLCRQRACVNPAHLEAVTPAENSRRGSRARLTAAEVAEIRQRRAAGETTVALGAEYGVNSGHISRIASGKMWKDAP